MNFVSRSNARTVVLVIALLSGSSCKSSGSPTTGGGQAAPGAGAGGQAGSSASGSGPGASAGAGTDPFDAGGCTHPRVETKCSDGWCEIPAGCFVMGSPESEWGHAPIEEQRVAVTLTRSFAIQQSEVTRREWTALGFRDPSVVPADGGPSCQEPACPIGNVTWFEAAAYANLLSERHDPPLAPCYRLSECERNVGDQMTCRSAEATALTVYDCDGYRLPTDAEWEYAARAGTRTAFYSGAITAYGETEWTSCNTDEVLRKIGWYCQNSGSVAHPVMQLEPNAWGLYDVAGNVSEWINDPSDGRGASSPTDPGGVVGSGNRNRRGGWFGIWAIGCRMADQGESSWNLRDPGVGFRLARTLR